MRTRTSVMTQSASATIKGIEKRPKIIVKNNTFVISAKICIAGER